MTETTTQPRTEDPAAILMTLIIAFLAPMFLGVSGGNIALARMAAIETITAYRARNHADLIAVAQIIAFGLAALGSLSLSLADDMSVSMALRLRGNANACNRSAEQNRRTLREQPAPMCEDTEDDTPVSLSPAAEAMLAAESEARLRDHDLKPAPAPKTAEQQNQQIWAAAMIEEAMQLKAGIDDLPFAQRKLATMQVEALVEAATYLRSDSPTPPFATDRLPGIPR
jgi:hypothetical protein